MNFYLEGNQLIVKNLFHKKSYSFHELTKISFKKHVLTIYKGNDCILSVKNYLAPYPYPLHHLAMENNLILEDDEFFLTEIPVWEVRNYTIEVQQKLQNLLQEYVNQTLGLDYQLIVTLNGTPCLVLCIVDIYHNGKKVCMNDEHCVSIFSDIVNGIKEFHLCWFELVMPTYINPHTQEFILTKNVELTYNIEETIEQIDKLKQYGITYASQFGC